jgi:hypothetical protein
MSAQQPPTQPTHRPSVMLGIAIGCLPIVVAVVAAFGIVHCRMGPMSYGYCSGADQGRILTISVIALCGWVLELLAGIIGLIPRHLRRVGIGLLVMAALFLPLSIMALYTEAFFLIGHQ